MNFMFAEPWWKRALRALSPANPAWLVVFASLALTLLGLYCINISRGFSTVELAELTGVPATVNKAGIGAGAYSRQLVYFAVGILAAIIVATPNYRLWGVLSTALGIDEACLHVGTHAHDGMGCSARIRYCAMVAAPRRILGRSGRRRTRSSGRVWHDETAARIFAASNQAYPDVILQLVIRTGARLRSDEPDQRLATANCTQLRLRETEHSDRSGPCLGGPPATVKDPAGCSSSVGHRPCLLVWNYA